MTDALDLRRGFRVGGEVFRRDDRAFGNRAGGVAVSGTSRYAVLLNRRLCDNAAYARVRADRGQVRARICQADGVN